MRLFLLFRNYRWFNLRNQVWSSTQKTNIFWINLGQDMKKKLVINLSWICLLDYLLVTCNTYKTICTGGHAKRQIQADTSRYKQIQADTSRYKQIQADTTRYKQIQADTTRYDQIQTDTNRYNQIQTDTNRYIQIKPDTT